MKVFKKVFESLSKDHQKILAGAELELKLQSLIETKDLLVLSQNSHGAVMARESPGENNAVSELTTVKKEITDLKQLALELDLAIS